MKPWAKEGILNGMKFMGLFFIVSLMWAIIIKISSDLGISPGWSMLVILCVAVFSFSISSAKTKYELDQKFGDKI